MEGIAKMSSEEREIEQKMIKIISGMPKTVQDRFKVLHMLSDERSKINDEFDLKVKELQMKFAEKKKPLLELRNKIVSGEVADFSDFVPKFDAAVPELETIVAGIVKSDKEDEDEEPEKPHTATDVSHLKGVAGVPDFWSRAVKQNQILMQAVRPKDAELMDCITNVTASRSEDPPTVSIAIDFKENDFFTNKQLTLTIRMKENSDSEVAETNGCLIEWKDGKDLSKKKIKKKQKHKKTNETRTIIKTVPAETFFNVFESKKAPEDEADEDDENEERENLLDALDEAMHVAEDFHDLYTRDALEYYLGFGQDLGDFGGMGGEDGEGDDQDDEDEEEKPKKKGVKPQSSQ